MTENEPLDETALWTLIEAVVNGDASAEQHRGLEQRLLGDQRARDAWLNYANLHASLNRWFLASASAESWEDDIVDLPLMISRESLQTLKPRRSHVGWIGLSVAACLLVVLGIYQMPWLRSLIELAGADGPTIAQFTGQIEIQSADGRAVSATERYAVRLGETVVSNSDEGRVVLRYADGTGIVLLGPSALTVSETPRRGKQLTLINGLLQADVAPQSSDAPLLIVTPQARVRVLGTRFELSTDDQAGTRLDLESGQVELFRGDEKPVKIEPNSIAIVPTSADPIHVSPRPAIVDDPQRETVFNGLKSVKFSGDGKTLIAGTRWQALFWHDDDRLEVVPFSTHGRQGISLRQQVNSWLAYFDHHEQNVKIWDAQTRRSESIFDEITELRRQFPSAVNRPRDWNPAAAIAVVSPRGDWLAFQIGREFRVWRAGTDRWPKFARNYDGQFVGALASSPDGETLAVAVRRGKVDLVDVRTGRVTTSWSLRHEVPLAMEFSASGKFLAVGLAGHVAVHDATTGDVLADFAQPGLPFMKVAISADGRHVAASSLGDRVWMWRVAGGVDFPLIDIGGPVQDLTFAPSGDRLAVLSRGGRLSVWIVAPQSETPIPKTETKSK